MNYQQQLKELTWVGTCSRQKQHFHSMIFDNYLLFLRMFVFFFIFLFTTQAIVSAKELRVRVNVNSATVEELSELPSMEEEKALAIVNFRNRYGRINDLSILLEKGLLKRQTFDAIKPYITVKGSSQLQYVGRNKRGNRSLSAENPFPSTIHPQEEIRVLSDKKYYTALLETIRQAQKRIDMAMFLFKTTKAPYNRPARIVSALIAAGKRGVHVRVLLEDSDYHKDVAQENKKVAKKLRKNGIEVVFDSPDKTTHSKVVVIDEHYVFVGSHNLTHSALAGNNELSLLVTSRKLAAEILAYLDKIPAGNE